MAWHESWIRLCLERVGFINYFIIIFYFLFWEILQILLTHKKCTELSYNDYIFSFRNLIWNMSFDDFESRGASPSRRLRPWCSFRRVHFLWLLLPCHLHSPYNRLIWDNIEKIFLRNRFIKLDRIRNCEGMNIWIAD